MKSEFLPRAHSKKLGELDRSNWKDLGSKRNVERLDPAIRDVVLLLNQKRYSTFSCCSGGHSSNPRRTFDRHESGYIAFSPPSRVAFILYLALRRKNRDFGFEAQALIDDGDGGGSRWETFCTRIYWQLRDDRQARLKYYSKLFSDLRQLVEALPNRENDHDEVLSGLLGEENFRIGSRIVNAQMTRFRKTS